MTPDGLGPDVAPVLGFLGAHPWVLPAVLGLLVVAGAVAAPLARRLGCSRTAAGLLVLACTVPVALTLSPVGAGPGPGLARRCLTQLRPVSTWGRGGEELANLLMLAPAGLLLVLLLGRRARLLALPAAAAFPPLVEAVQFAVPRLGRSCETTDVLLNLGGLLVGAGAGVLARRLRRPRPGPGPRPSASPGT